jgi:hypothetical protein
LPSAHPLGYSPGSHRLGNCAASVALRMNAEISFDCYYPEDCDHIEGCYRLPGEEWRVFYFTRWWQGKPEVRPDAVWRSGITGVQVNHPKDAVLNNSVVMQVLSSALGVTHWTEVRGPDSLQLK